MNRIIGAREFTDRSQRAVYQDDDGRQFVIDDEGQAAYGTWILPDEPTAILDRAEEGPLTGAPVRV